MQQIHIRGGVIQRGCENGREKSLNPVLKRLTNLNNVGLLKRSVTVEDILKRYFLLAKIEPETYGYTDKCLNLRKYGMVLAMTLWIITPRKDITQFL